MPAAAFGLSLVALVVAAVACALALVLMRQNATTTEELREHRRAHRDAYGYPDPRLDRRQRNLPPPAATGERRGRRHVEPPVDAHMPARPTPEQLEQPAYGDPTDGYLEQPAEQPPTAEHAPPTAELRAADRPRPRP